MTHFNRTHILFCPEWQLPSLPSTGNGSRCCTGAFCSWRRGTTCHSIIDIMLSRVSPGCPSHPDRLHNQQCGLTPPPYSKLTKYFPIWVRGMDHPSYLAAIGFERRTRGSPPQPSASAIAIILVYPPTHCKHANSFVYVYTYEWAVPPSKTCSNFAVPICSRKCKDACKPGCSSQRCTFGGSGKVFRGFPYDMFYAQLSCASMLMCILWLLPPCSVLEIWPFRRPKHKRWVYTTNCNISQNPYCDLIGVRRSSL